MNNFKTLLLLLLSTILLACSAEKDENVWIIGTSADNPPYEFMKDGEIVGFDIDLITEIGKHLGKKVEFKNMEFHSLLAALSTGNVDMVLAGLSITPERQVRADFSVPYTSATVAVLYRRDDGFRDSTDMVHKKVGAQLGSIFSVVAHDLAVKYQCQVSALSSNLHLVEELKSRRLDAVILEEAQADKFVEMYSHLSKFLITDFTSSFAIAMPKGTKLKINVDHTIKALKSNGTLNALEKRWGIEGGN